MEQVILKQEVRKLGERGDIVAVAAGYARNFLYPRNLAMPATAANTKQIEEMRAAGAREAARLTDDASKLAETMDGVTVRTVVRAGDSGQLFGSVGARDIAQLLTDKGFPVDRHKVVLGSPLKETGDHDVRIHLYRDVNVTAKVEIRAEGREDELFGEAKEAAQAAAAQAEAEEAAVKAAEEAAAEAAAEEEQAADLEAVSDVVEAAEDEADRA